MADPIYNEQFYTEFYQKHGGGDYTDKSLWMPFFNNIADQIIAVFNPRTVLDAGCAMGYLVEALRARGVQAYGIDISEYAVSRVADAVKPYCFVHSITEPFTDLDTLPQRFDLVVTIEVLEHIPPEFTESAIANLSNVTDAVLFSSTPNIADDSTHLNVQFQEEWVKSFAKNHFFRALSGLFTFISPWAILLKKGTDVPGMIHDYEYQIRLMSEQIMTQDAMAQTMLLNDESIQSKIADVKQLNEQIRQLNDTNNMMAVQIEGLDFANQTLQEENDQLRQDKEELLKSTAWRITKPIRMLIDIAKWIFIRNPLLTNVKKVRRLIKKEGLMAATKKVAHKIVRRFGNPEEIMTNGQEAQKEADTNPVKKSVQDRRLQAVPSFHVLNTVLRLNYLTDAIMEGEIPAKVPEALRLSSHLARELDCPLRIITRTSEADPYVFSKIARDGQFELPADITYYSDFDRDAKGSKSFKLELSDHDIFMTDSIFGLMASRWTSYASTVLFYVHDAGALAKSEKMDSEHFNKILMDKNVHFLFTAKQTFDGLTVKLPVIRSRSHLVAMREQEGPIQAANVLEPVRIREIALLIEEEIDRVSN